MFHDEHWSLVTFIWFVLYSLHKRPFKSTYLKQVHYPANTTFPLSAENKHRKFRRNGFSFCVLGTNNNSVSDFDLIKFLKRILYCLSAGFFFIWSRYLEVFHNTMKETLSPFWSFVKKDLYLVRARKLIFLQSADFTWNPQDFTWNLLDFMKSVRFDVKSAGFQPWNLLDFGRFHAWNPLNQIIQEKLFTFIECRGKLCHMKSWNLVDFMCISHEIHQSNRILLKTMEFHRISHEINRI